MLEAGDRIGDWIVVDALGEGGMGAVYRCHNVLSERVVAAVKVLKPHSMADARQRFVREVELLASVQHSAVVRVLGCGEDADRKMLWLAMELLDGEELTDRLEREGPLPWEDACRYFRQLGEGLLAAHDKGVVHRDIKPQNIFLCRDGTAKLLDFGIAVAKGGTQLTQAGMVPGTVAYMAPEVFEGQRPDHRADIYALGQVLWEALTGEQAYPEDGGLTPDQMIVRTMGKKLSAEAMDPGETFPLEVRDLVRRATDPDVDTRLEDLRAFVRMLAGEGPPPERPRPPPPPKRRGVSPVVWGTLVGLLFLLVAVPVATLAVVGGGGALFWMTASTSPPAGPPPQAASGGAVYSVPQSVPDGFPLWVPDDAKMFVSVKQDLGGVPSYTVSYNTKMDSGALATRYARAAEKLDLQVMRSEDYASVSFVGMGEDAVLNITIDWEIDKATTGQTRVTINWLPDGPP